MEGTHIETKLQEPQVSDMPEIQEPQVSDMPEEPVNGYTSEKDADKPTPDAEVSANLTGPVEAEDKDKGQTGEDKKSEKQDEDGKKDKEKDKNEDEKKKPVNGTKTPKNKDKGGNSASRKIRRFFSCGSNSQDAGDDCKNIEGEEVHIFITDKLHCRKVDVGMSLATTTAELGGTPSTHVVTSVARNGLADQFGIRECDEMLMLNYFSMLGMSNKEVAMLFIGEELPRKTRLLFRRRVPNSKKTAYDYHFVTGDIVELKHPDGGTPDKVEYHVNNLTHQIVRDTDSEVIVSPPEKVYVQYVEDTQLYFSFQDDQLSATTGFDASDKYTYEMIVRIVIEPDLVPEVVFRHLEDAGVNYMFMNQSGDNMEMKVEQNLDGSLPKDISPSETLIYVGVSNPQQIYAFESVVREESYMSVRGSDVIVNTIPAGRTLADDTAFQFHVFSPTGGDTALDKLRV